MSYIDLNPIGAKITARPEQSRHISAYGRITVRNRYHTVNKLKTTQSKAAEKLLIEAGLPQQLKHNEGGLWLTPMKGCVVGDVLVNKRFTVDEYLTLLDVTGDY